MNNLLSYCGLTDARMKASEKDLPVLNVQILTNHVQVLILCLSYFITTVKPQSIRKFS
jgi:hypothetical protein